MIPSEVNWHSVSTRTRYCAYFLYKFSGSGFFAAALVDNADNIIVMNHGSIVETGNHDTLMGKDGFYADLYNSQFAR